MIRIVFSIFIVLGFDITAVMAAQANVFGAADIAVNIEQNKKKIQAAELRQRKVLSGLFDINRRIKRTVTERGAYSQQRAVIEENINSVTKKVAELDGKTKSQRALLGERLRAIYKLGSPSVARYIFAAESSYVLDRNLKILGIVAERDFDLIKNYTYDLKELQSRKRALATRLESLKIIERKISGQEKKLNAEQLLKAKLLDGIRKSKMFAENQMMALKEKSMKAPIEDAGVFDLLFKPAFSDHKGNLPLPIEGMVIRKFGLFKSKEHSYTISNKGVIISSGEGQPIKSVFEGKVSFVGDVPGLGKTLILDHGDHYYTVYGNTDSIKVNQGDEVKQSQIIAATGHRRLVDGDDAPQEHVSGLYFEIRHFSEPYDPQLWMKGL